HMPVKCTIKRPLHLRARPEKRQTIERTLPFRIISF
ncbi:MAG: hypothetical protein ACI81P_002197, partial [Neolewinella sp.]